MTSVERLRCGHGTHRVCYRYPTLHPHQLTSHHLPPAAGLLLTCTPALPAAAALLLQGQSAALPSRLSSQQMNG